MQRISNEQRKNALATGISQFIDSNLNLSNMDHTYGPRNLFHHHANYVDYNRKVWVIEVQRSKQKSPLNSSLFHGK